MGTVELYRLRQTILRQRNSKETGQLDYQVWATRSYGDVAEMVERSLRMREVRGIDTQHLQI